MRKRVHIFYSGYVQGVGFRFTTERIAHKLGVTGWVRNLIDGRVEVIAEAEETVLKRFIEQIEEQMRGYIRNAKIDWTEAQNEFGDFEIRF